MFCKNCGAEIDDKAVVCPKCGVAVKREEEKKASVLSIIGFVLSLLAWVIDIWLIFAIKIAAFVCSIIGVVTSKKLNQKNQGLGVAGIVISAVNIVYKAIILLFAISLL